MVGSNVERLEGFSQVCVWPGTVLDGSTVEEFVEFFAGEGWRIQYLEEIATAPDMANGEPVDGTGGRIDQFFAIHEGDVGKFSVPRLAMGIRWLEDVMGSANGYDSNPLYPERVSEYLSWSA